MLKHYHKVLGGIEHKLGYASLVICIASSTIVICNYVVHFCIARGKRRYVWTHHMLLNRTEHKPGSACQAMCIDSNISLYHGPACQSYTAIKLLLLQGKLVKR